MIVVKHFFFHMYTSRRCDRCEKAFAEIFEKLLQKMYADIFVIVWQVCS